MVPTRLRIFLGILVVFACHGCSPAFIERKPGSLPLTGDSLIPVLPSAQESVSDPLTQPLPLDELELSGTPTGSIKYGSKLQQQSPADQRNSFSAPPSQPEFLLADLDRALNSPGSDLPPHYQDYLRQQLTAIAARSGTALDVDCTKLSPAGGNDQALPATPGDPALAVTTATQPPAAIERGAVQPVVATSGDEPSDPEQILDNSPAREEVTQPDPENLAVANQSSASPPGAWRDHLQKTLDALEQDLERARPGDRDGEHLAAAARLLYLVGNHRDQAVAEIEQMNEDEREYWKHQIHALIVALDTENKHAGSRRAALALREIRDAADHLANLSALDVRHLAFCESVRSYGVYTPVKSSSLKPGQEVLLYVEIDNFVSEQIDDRFETRLQAEYHITDEHGERISKQLPLVEEKGRNRRRDYFISYQMEIPKDLRPGEYSLQLIIEDVIGRKSSQASLDFRVR